MNKFFKSKKAQEEMVGFALILIIVSVIILVFFFRLCIDFSISTQTPL